MKEKIYKVYQFVKIYTSYTYFIMVNDMLFAAEFKGGSTAPIYSGGIFSTEDVDVAEAIEKLDDFNDKFVCIYSSEVKIEPAAVVQEIKESLLPEVVEPTIVTGVKNSVEAKKWLNINFAVPHSQMPNVKAVRDMAAEKNVVFPEWKIE
jgi:hypothetical protein